MECPFDWEHLQEAAARARARLFGEKRYPHRHRDHGSFLEETSTGVARHRILIGGDGGSRRGGRHVASAGRAGPYVPTHETACITNRGGNPLAAGVQQASTRLDGSGRRWAKARRSIPMPRCGVLFSWSALLHYDNGERAAVLHVLHQRFAAAPPVAQVSDPGLKRPSLRRPPFRGARS